MQILLPAADLLAGRATDQEKEEGPGHDTSVAQVATLGNYPRQLASDIQVML